MRTKLMINQVLDGIEIMGTTREGYAYQIAWFGQWLEKRDLDFNSLNKALFEEYLASRDWKPNSKYAAYCAIRTFIRWHLGDDHPALQYHLKRKPTPPQRTLDQEQLAQLVHGIDRSTSLGIRNSAIVALMADTGLRAKEICQLEINHLKLNRGICDVIVKGGEWEPAAFSETTTKRLRLWLETRESVLANLVSKGKLRQPEIPQTVFVGINGHTPGQALTPSGLRCIFESLGKRAGLGQISPHDMRRTFCTLSLEFGANTRQVQVLGRWKSIDLVERYSKALIVERARRNFPFPMNNFE